MEEPDEETDELARETYRAALEVHKRVGPGYLESVYEEGLAAELDIRDVPFERQAEFTIDYKDREIGRGRTDFVVDDRLVVELKAITTFKDIHRAQVISYLKALDLDLGLLFNFNAELLKDGVQRIIHSESATHAT
ncbi:MAG: GxxExxY protein [Bradymonadaceae bacterium]